MPEEQENQDYQNFQSKQKIKRLITILLVILVVLAAVSYFFYRNRLKVEIEDKKQGRVTEIEIGTKEIPLDPNGDFDGDGLSNRQEEALGTNPKSEDSDDDGILDGEELFGFKTDPLKIDTDNDQLADYNEVKVWQTDPLNQDSDNDGFTDGQEVANGFNPLGSGGI